MRRWATVLLGVGVLAILFLVLNLGRHWSAIFLLLAIIFYGLFANPMKRVHEGLAPSPRRDRKKSSSRARKRK